MYAISRYIYAILDNQFFCKSRHSVRIMYTISRWIFAALDIQFFFKSRYFLRIMYTFPCSGYSIFLEIQTIYTYNVHKFQLNLCNSRFLMFLQIRTICIYNAHNFPNNLCHSGYLIFLQIQSIRTYNVHNFRWIYTILDIPFLCKSRHSIHIIYTILAEFKQFLIFNFFAN